MEEEYISLLQRGEVLTKARKEARIGGLVYAIVGIVCTSTIASCLTLRLTTIRRSSSVRSLSAIQFLMLAIYIIGLAFCACTMVLFYGYGTEEAHACQLATIICLTFYMGQKLPVYIFLVERGHVVRAVTRRRLQDWYYIAGLLSVFLGFGALTTTLLIWRTWEYDSVQKICRIGFSTQVAISLLVFDVVFNLALTVLFLYYLRPYLTKGMLKAFVPRGVADLMISKMARGRSRPRGISIAIPQKALIRVIRNTILGCIAMCLESFPNMVVMVILGSHEETWLCFMLCTTSVTWAVLVTHWLTTIHSDFGSLRLDNEQRQRYLDFEASRHPRSTALPYMNESPQWCELELDEFTNLSESIHTKTSDRNPSPTDERATVDIIFEDLFGSAGIGRFSETTNDGREAMRE